MMVHAGTSCFMHLTNQYNALDNEHCYQAYFSTGVTHHTHMLTMRCAPGWSYKCACAVAYLPISASANGAAASHQKVLAS